MSFALSEETRHRLKTLSKSMLHLHKALLDFEREEYEKVNGKVRSPNELFGLVIDHPHFAWLRILSGQIVLIDEFLASKKEVNEAEGLGLIDQARLLLAPEKNLDEFDHKLASALRQSGAAFIKYNAALEIME